MFSLFRENVRIALDSIKVNLRTILTSLLLGLAYGTGRYFKCCNCIGKYNFAICFMGIILLIFNNMNLRFKPEMGRSEKINPIISYNNVRIPISTVSIHKTSLSPRLQLPKLNTVRKTDPSKVYGVNEKFGEYRPKWTVANYNFDIQNNKVCLIGRFLKIYLKMKTQSTKHQYSRS